MSVSLYIFNMFVIGTEAESFRAGAVLCHPFYDGFQILGGAAFPDEYRHSAAAFLHGILIIDALVIRTYPRHRISLYFVIPESGSMAVKRSAFKQRKLLMHSGIPVDDGHVIHHLAQSKHPRVPKIRPHLFYRKITSIVVHRS